MYNRIIIKTGYAETESIASIMFKCNNKLKPKALLNSFVDYLEKKFEQNMGCDVIFSYNKECCRAYENKKRCADCGAVSNRDYDKSMNNAFIYDFITSLFEQNTDSFGSSDDIENPDGWDIDYECSYEDYILISSFEDVFQYKLYKKYKDIKPNYDCYNQTNAERELKSSKLL